MSTINMKSKKGNNVFISGDNNVVASNGSQVSSGFLNIQLNGFSFFNLFRKKEVIKLPEGVYVDEVYLNGKNINITLSNGSVIFRKGKKVSTSDTEIVIG